jgi:hypothetical protein
LEFLLFLFRRILWSILVLVGLSIVIFAIARVVPGDPARMALGPTATAQQVADLQEKLGLNKPIVEQYGMFIAGLSRGDLGRSLLTERPVNDDIRDTFAATFELVLATITLAFVLRRAARGRGGALEGQVARHAGAGAGDLLGGDAELLSRPCCCRSSPATCCTSCRPPGGCRTTWSSLPALPGS